MSKKTLLALAGAMALALPSIPAFAFQPGNVECIAPANPGGGWDFTCRQVGKALYDLKKVPGPVQVTNMPGASGGVAFASAVTKRAEDANLLVAASTATTTRLAQDKFPGMNKDMVRWVGTVGADYGIIAVAKDSPYKSLKDLIEVLKSDPSRISTAGGSAVGGWDHLKLLLAARAAGIKHLTQIKYIAFQGGGEALTQLLGGHVQAFSGDISEVQGHIEAGDVRVLAVLSAERLPGKLKDMPTAKEQGYDVEGANWRGFYVPKKASDDSYAYWAKAVEDVYRSAEWKKVMADNGLMPFDRQGPALDKFVSQQIDQLQELSKAIGLVK